MTEAVASGLSQFDLIWVSAATGSIFVESFIKFEITDKVSADCSIVEEKDDWTIWSMPDYKYFEIADKREELKQLERGLHSFPAAVLMNMVASFDSTIVDLIRSMFTLNSNLFRDLGRSVDVKEVLAASSIEDLQSQIINDEVYKFSRGSHDEQTAFIEKYFHIQIKKTWKRWPDFIEIFERRNLIAHGERLFNHRYVNICSSHGHQGSEKLLGSKIKLSQSYLSQSCDILIEYAVLTIFSLWRKHFKDQEEAAFSKINETVFNLILRKRYNLATRLSEYVLSIKSDGMSDFVRRMLIVNNASAYLHAENADKCKKVLKSVDWSASADNFKICVAALMDDMDEVERIMPIIAQTKAIEKNSFRTWPVFRFARENKRFQTAFEVAFNEPLLRNKSENESIQPSVSEDGNEDAEVTPPEVIPDANTLH